MVYVWRRDKPFRVYFEGIDNAGETSHWAVTGTVTAFIGFKIGSKLRNFLSSENFYKILWILFLLTGLRLALTAISKF